MNHKVEFLEVISQVQFDKIHTMMQAVDWKWYSLPEGGVPTIKEMFETVHSLFTHAYARYLKSGIQEETSTGGFTVVVNADEIIIRFGYSVGSY